MIYVDRKMVDFRDPKKLLITAATGIAYFFLRNRMLPENPAIDAAAAGGAYLGSRRTTGNVKAALEGVAIGAGASLALSLAKMAPAAFAAAPTAKAPEAAPQIPQIVVHVPASPPPPPPPPPVVQVSPQIALSQELAATQVVEVSQEVSQQLEQLQQQLEELSRRLEETTQPQPSPSPSPPSEEPVVTLPVMPPWWSPPEEPGLPSKEPVVTLPVMPPWWSPPEEPGLPSKEPVVTLPVMPPWWSPPEEPGEPKEPWDSLIKPGEPKEPWESAITQPITSGPVTTTEPMLSSRPQEPVSSPSSPEELIRSFDLLNMVW